MMRPFLPLIAAIALAGSAAAVAGEADSWLERAWSPVAEAYQKGNTEIYLPFRTYHLRSAYSREKIDSYQEHPPGFGLGRGFYNENGNYQGVYAMGFQDSHFRPQWMAGYVWRAIWRPANEVKLGLGATAFLMARTDFGHYTPFPGVLPTASVSYKKLSLETTFIPGARGYGNVLFFWGKWEFGQ
ncbi:MAG TPA: lipid IV(A) palmitoyltransferase PagP [Azospira sp.]|nr:lipid IV(A) palmitoyltransferase PagP [Azospira sp.]